MSDDNNGYSSYTEIGTSDMVVMTSTAVRPALAALLANAKAQIEDNYMYTEWIGNERNNNQS